MSLQDFSFKFIRYRINQRGNTQCNILEEWGELNPKTADQEVINEIEILLGDDSMPEHNLKIFELNKFSSFACKTYFVFFKIIHELNYVAFFFVFLCLIFFLFKS